MVTVFAKDAYGRVQSQGSGVMIGPRMLITNQHVTRSGGRLRVVGEAGRYWGTLVTASRKADFALVRLPENGFGYLRFGPRPRIGQQVFAVGTPLGRSGRVSSGRVQGFRDLGEVERIHSTARIQPGSSGGALINPQAELVGVTSAIDERSGESIAISTASLARYLVDQGFLKPSAIPRGPSAPAPGEADPEAVGDLIAVSFLPALLFFGLVFLLGQNALGPNRPQYGRPLAFLFVWAVTALAAGMVGWSSTDAESGEGDKEAVAFFVAPLIAALVALFVVGAKSRGAPGKEESRGKNPVPANGSALPGQGKEDAAARPAETPSAPRVVVRPQSGGGFAVLDRYTGQVLENVEDQAEAVRRAGARNQSTAPPEPSKAPAQGDEGGKRYVVRFRGPHRYELLDRETDQVLNTLPSRDIANQRAARLNSLRGHGGEDTEEADTAPREPEGNPEPLDLTRRLRQQDGNRPHGKEAPAGTDAPSSNSGGKTVLYVVLILVSITILTGSGSEESSLHQMVAAETLGPVLLLFGLVFAVGERLAGKLDNWARAAGFFGTWAGVVVWVLAQGPLDEADILRVPSGFALGAFLLLLAVHRAR
ncbi:MAG: S1C family serine protease [Thiohalospira sp.]